jgi:hypothetical protein
VPGRGLESGSRQSSENTLELIYKKVRTYRDRYPDKAIIDALHADRKAWWAFFMAGGSLLVRGQLEYPGSGDPEAYEPPVGVDEILLSYRFLRQDMAEPLTRMRPIDLTQDSGHTVWCLADPGRIYMAYLPQGGEAAFEQNELSEGFRAQWFNPRSGELLTATEAPTARDLKLRFVAPNQQDWVLILKARSTQ